MRLFSTISLVLILAAVAPAYADEPPKLEPVSSRLSSHLQHSNQGKDATDSIVEIHFSPDGKRLIAGDYPGGSVNEWDVGSGKRLATIETGPGGHSSCDYFAISPDWKTIYAPTAFRGFKVERFKIGGKPFFYCSFDDAVQVFDLESGKLLHSWQHTPPREITTLTLSPDGAYLLTSDGLPGVYEGDDCTRTVTLWNTQTGSQQALDNHPTASKSRSP
jgi:WD40 repeat protein